MLAQFVIVLLAILVAGPLENEGGAAAIKEKGTKAAVDQALRESVPLQADVLGNYGNQ